MTIPPRLQKNDVIFLTAPSSPLQKEPFVEEIAHAVEGLGFRVRIGDTCRSAAPCGYAAASPQSRADELNRAFADPTINAIWCVRGGSTAWQILPLLDYAAIQRTPKAFIGFSDITSLHMALQQRCSLMTFHGPVANRVPAWKPDDFSWQSLRAALGGWQSLPLENPPGVPLTVLRPGIAQGILTGGNLSLIAASMGTPWQLDAKGKILFLEDVDEPVYALDRMLWQLRYAGIFGQAAGVILGVFTDCVNERRPEYDLCALVRDFFADYPKPVLYGLQSAHVPVMTTLPLGAVCVMDGHDVTAWRENAAV